MDVITGITYEDLMLLARRVAELAAKGKEDQGADVSVSIVVTAPRGEAEKILQAATKVGIRATKQKNKISLSTPGHFQGELEMHQAQMMELVLLAAGLDVKINDFSRLEQCFERSQRWE